MTRLILPRVGGGGDDYPQQQMQAVESEPDGSVWVSAPMLGLYGTVILAAVPIVLLWLRKRWRMREA